MPGTPPVPHHRITFITVEDSVHYKHLHLEVPDGVVTISGGFGSGKTTLGLFLCYALDAGFPAHLEKKILAQIAARLGHGKITVGLCSQHGVKLTVSRTLHQAPVVKNAQGQRVDMALDGELFRIEAYQQGELKDIAATPASLLALVDGFAPEETRQASEAIAATLHQLERNATDLRRLDLELAGAEDQLGEMASVEAALAAVVEAPGPEGACPAPPRRGPPEDAEASRAAHEAKIVRGREAAALAGLARETGAAKSAIHALAADVLRRLGGAVEGAHERGPNGALFAAAHARVQAFAGAIEAAAGALRAQAEATEAALADAARALGAAHAQADEDYRTLMLRLEEDRGRAEERERLQKRLVDLSTMARRVAGQRAEREARRAERRAHLTALGNARRALRDVRRRITGELNAQLRGGVTIQVEPGADSKACTEMLAEVLRGLGLHTATLANLAASMPFHELAEAARANDVERIVAADRSKTGKVERGTNILQELRGSDRLYELETVAPGDVPRLLLRVGAGKEDYVDIANGSPGQRCTATLALVLLQSVGLLFIDQPEDHVSAPYIRRVFVPALRRAKGRRQMILITHAPNIPVLADAELVAFVEPEGTGGRLRSAGTVDAQRKDIESHLDGGREAFLKRAETYGHTPRRQRKDDEAEGDEWYGEDEEGDGT
jgi:ABC-type multidrug transport system ATPase subunit